DRRRGRESRAAGRGPPSCQSDLPVDRFGTWAEANLLILGPRRAGTCSAPWMSFDPETERSAVPTWDTQGSAPDAAPQERRSAMVVSKLLSPFRDTQGVALVTALIALMLLSSLVIAFAVLATSEPTIASNQSRATQARTLAESGVEQAIWALGSATVNTGAAPYDGSAFVAMGSAGGFFLTVTNGAAPNEKIVDAVGWYPTYSAAAAEKNARRHVHATLTHVKWLNPPAALTVEGDVQTNGSAVTISAAADTSCGNKDGAMASGTITSSGSPTIVGGG